MEENISIPDLYVCETSPPISDQFISILGSVGEQSSLPLIHLPSFYSTSSTEKHTADKIQHLSAETDSNGTLQKIEIFVSCKSCCTTYSYIFKSTTFLKKHNCESSCRKIDSTSSLSQTSSSSQSLITAYGHPKSVRLPDSHSKEMKELVARWIYKDMRPFAIEDDASFREIALYM